jgi:hypothetical protein
LNDIRPKNPLTWIKYRYLEWRWDRILRKSGHHHWESYLRYNDPDFYAPGYTVRDQLHGYPHIVKVDYEKLPYRFDPLWGPIEHCELMIEWCNTNCRGKYRNHWERVIMDHAGQYLPNGIGGTDELFFAFKDERDYIMFTLRWG